MNFRTFVLASFILLSFAFAGCAGNRKESRDNSLAETNKAGTESGKELAQPQEIKPVVISEYILGPGDKIEITVYRNDDLKRSIQIDPYGMISFPLVGDIQASGMSIFRLRDRIRDGLLKYINNPQVTIAVTGVQSQKITVLGEVRSPGVLALETPINAVEAISRAGGFTLEAKKKNVLLIRGGLNKPELITLNIDRVFRDHDMEQNLALQSGDIIYVPSTTIADVSRFFDHLARIISPIVGAEAGYYIGQQIEGGSSTSRIVVPAR